MKKNDSSPAHELKKRKKWLIYLAWTNWKVNERIIYPAQMNWKWLLLCDYFSKWGLKHPRSTEAQHELLFSPLQSHHSSWVCALSWSELWWIQSLSREPWTSGAGSDTGPSQGTFTHSFTPHRSTDQWNLTGVGVNWRTDPRRTWRKTPLQGFSLTFHAGKCVAHEPAGSVGMSLKAESSSPCLLGSQIPQRWHWRSNLLQFTTPLHYYRTAPNSLDAFIPRGIRAPLCPRQHLFLLTGVQIIALLIQHRHSRWSAKGHAWENPISSHHSVFLSGTDVKVGVFEKWSCKAIKCHQCG